MYRFDALDIVVTGYPEPKNGGMTTGIVPRGIKVLHKATGLVAVCDKHRHQHLNRDEALSELAKALDKLKVQ